MATKWLSGRTRRHVRIRRRVRGVPSRPRLVVFRSNKHIYAQMVDDTTGKTILGVCGSSKTVAGKAQGASEQRFAESVAVGGEIARIAMEKGISSVVFDRAGYRYHGQVKALADAARKAGLKF
jgi:large subunit ribosomal protein L18